MCRECDRLRAKNRELMEELEEWRNMDSVHESGDYITIAATLKTNPQPAKLISILAENENRVVGIDFFTDALQYSGMGGGDDRRGTNEARWLKVVVAHARRALESVGIFDAVANVRGRGYLMTKQKAAEVRAVVGIEK